MLKAKLSQQETLFLTLRSIYQENGYRFYRMKRFEEYDFYADKKDFLTSPQILTFNDADGKLMALRPDVTLSIIKHAPSGKYYYHENVYRVPANSTSFCEIPQSGIECTGDVSDDDLYDVLRMAVMSLDAASEGRKCALDVADAGMAARLIQHNHSEILNCLAGKNIHGLKELNADDELIRLAEGDVTLHLPESLGEISSNVEIHTDFSCVENIKYYNGLVFKGYIDGIPDAVLSGGQYEMDGKKGAGFAVYLDRLGGVYCD